VKSIKEKVIYEDRIQNVIKTTEVPEVTTEEVKKYVNRIIEVPREDVKTINVERWKEVSEPSVNEIVVYKEVPKFNDVTVEKEVQKIIVETKTTDVKVTKETAAPSTKTKNVDKIVEKLVKVASGDEGGED